jgi:hypothetical protein
VAPALCTGVFLLLVTMLGASNGYAWEAFGGASNRVLHERGLGMASHHAGHVIHALPPVNMTLASRRSKYRAGINFSPAHLNVKRGLPRISRR